MHPLILAAAFAAAPTPTPSSTPLKVIETIVTSDRRSEPLDTTSRPTFVVTRAQIEAHGAQTIAAALRGVPGMTFISYGGFGSQTTAGIRGAIDSSAQNLILIDGTPINAASNGTIDLGALSTAGVSRIEVVEGGLSTLYGTSAVGGVVNIITDVPRGTYVAASSGSYGDRDLRAAVGNGRLGIAFDRHVAENGYAYPGFDGFAAG
ncbi:MAG: TonB-dependent receptor, partial [bacterium]|nr:TonB-dependent receptor [bacterium]